ncbi:MAG: RDD family protein [Clostridium sp.]|jgi:uncharacterized RDD family membrane protein YckC|nr:RDD family protein [Clostridium sp.]
MLKRIFANVLDEVIIFAISGILCLLAQVIMKPLGFEIKQVGEFLLIMYAIVYVLYFSILEGSSFATTIGKRLLKLDK